MIPRNNLSRNSRQTATPPSDNRTVSTNNDESIIDTPNESTPEDSEPYLDNEDHLIIENTEANGVAPTPENNMLCEAYLNNMRN